MPRYKEEAHARKLMALLEQTFASPPASLALAMEGAGVHWHVDARAQARSCRVHAFHYYRQGAEYYLVLFEGTQELASGRTRLIDEVAPVLQAWLLEETSLQELYSRFSFIDQQKRALEALRGKVDAVLERLGSARRCGLAQQLSDIYGLNVEGNERDCELEALGPGSEARCRFRHRGTILAVGESPDVDALATAVGRWLDAGDGVEPLTREFSFVHAEPHALAYEQGRYAEWLWDFHVSESRREQLEKSARPLVAHLPLLERMALHPVIRRFFFFTSVDALCFSRCPRYPFSTKGLPVIIPRHHPRSLGADPGPVRYTVRCGERKMDGDVEAVCRFVEEVLTAEGDTTFYGSLERRE
jgi:hypothetical protein